MPLLADIAQRWKILAGILAILAAGAGAQQWYSGVRGAIASNTGAIQSLRQEMRLGVCMQIKEQNADTDIRECMDTFDAIAP